MIACVTDAADLGVEDAAEALAAGERCPRGSSSTHCLAPHPAQRNGRSQPRRRPGARSTRGCASTRRTRSAAADRADERLAAGDAPELCGIPIGPRRTSTPSPGSRSPPRAGSSTRCPTRDCDAWARPRRRRAWSCSATCTRTSSPAAAPPTRSATPGPSSARRAARAAAPAAALASKQVPAATGTDTAGLAAHPLGGVRDVDDQADAWAHRRSAGSCPWRRPSTTPGPWPRAVRDCEPLLAALAGVEPPPGSAGRSAGTPSLRASPTSTRTSPTGSNGRSRLLPGRTGGAVSAAGPARRARRLLRARAHRDAGVPPPLRRSARCEYRPAIRARLEHAETAGDDGRGIRRRAGRARRKTPPPGATGSMSNGIDAIVEPTLPIVAPVRGQRLRRAVRRPRRPVPDPLLGLDRASRSSASPSGVGSRSGLPVSVSLIGRPHRGLGPARLGHGTPGRARDSGAVIDSVSSPTTPSTRPKPGRANASAPPTPC